MALHLYSLTVDARDHRALARWWAEVLGWRIGYEDEHECEVLPPEASPDPVDETATVSYTHLTLPTICSV